MQRVGSFVRALPGWSSLTPEIELRSRDILYGLAALAVLAATVFLVLRPEVAHAASISLPGDDASDKLEAAGTLLKIIDTGIFQWGARIFAGICLLSSGWAFKEQRFGVAIVCVLGAIVIGTAPAWVKNIFDIGGNQSLFSENQSFRYEVGIRPYPGAWTSCPQLRADAELPES